MAEKLTKRIPAKRKKAVKQKKAAKRTPKDEWLEKIAGSYHTGMKDVLAEFIRKQ